MTKEEKIAEMVESLKKENDGFVERSFSLVAHGEPKPYARARFRVFGKHVHTYNTRENYMNELKDKFLEDMAIDDIALINDLINNQDEYYVYVSGKFYVSIPKSDSIQTSAKKLAGLIKPATRKGDVDNYIKLVLDTLHDVTYDDDKHVIGISAEKIYSDDPRIELDITIKYRRGNNG